MDDEGKFDEFWQSRSKMEPDTTFRFRVAADQLIQKITPNSDIFVLAHFGVARIPIADWELHISGMVDRPTHLTFEDLLRFPKREIESFIKCAGFPSNPRIATRNASNAAWAGASLADVMESVGMHSQASFLWFYAPDRGSYQEWSAERYVKDLPVERVMAGDVLLAYEVNGEPLSPEHGFPLRLFVPGFYGTNSVKWLCHIEASDGRASGVFADVLYNDPVLSADGEPTSDTVPVWRVPPEALIVSPAANATLPRGHILVSGWCWGATAIDRVEISVDHGHTWHRATVAPRHQMSWQHFHHELLIETSGDLIISARATDADGATQPDKNARNAIHTIEVKVV
jgi:DMSO/TMAO reductase YedYZ molybdopterin-dependent catalytic subunit